MERHLFAFAMLLLLFGGAFAGTIVSVGETVPVGGTTTTTTTQTEPEEPAEEEPDTSSPFGGIKMTNEEGDSIIVGSEEGTFQVVETSEEDGAQSTEGSQQDSLTLGVPQEYGESPAPNEEGMQDSCAPAFALLALALFASRG